MKYIAVILFIIVLIACVHLIYYPVQPYELFENGLGPHGLYPSRDLYCEDRGMDKAYGPQTCLLPNGSWSETQNCRCADRQTGECLECYPPVNLNKFDDYVSSLQEVPLELPKK